MKIPVKLPLGSYDITVERGSLEKAGEICDLNRRVLIVTDDGVPKKYAETVAKQCKFPIIATLPMGEKSKSLETFSELCKTLLENGFTRSDCVVAVGGGVMGDLAGFAAASYMRGIDFYNIPTTVLSQVDSSVGGKTAVNFRTIKNIIGAFYQPKAVIIDPDTLSTLSERHFSNGMAEAVKMAVTFDEELFKVFEQGSAHKQVEEIIRASVSIKAKVVEKDEHEAGLRKVLNFGHTLGHAIESCENGEFFHGECVALGMLSMSSEEVKARLIPVLKSLNLPTEYHGDIEKIKSAAMHDKKFSGEKVTVIISDKIGSYRTEILSTDELFRRMEESL